MIDSFRGEHFYLSNMYPMKYRILSERSVGVATSEHAYQAAKFESEAAHRAVALVTAAERAKGERLDGIASKNLAHELIDADEPMRPNWNNIKLGVMHEVVQRKFIANPDIRDLLAATGDVPLIEGNDWGDVFWGVDETTGEGQNHLGLILQTVRTQIQTGRIR